MATILAVAQALVLPNGQVITSGGVIAAPALGVAKVAAPIVADYDPNPQYSYSYDINVSLELTPTTNLHQINIFIVYRMPSLETQKANKKHVLVILFKDHTHWLSQMAHVEL